MKKQLLSNDECLFNDRSNAGYENRAYPIDMLYL